MEDLPRERFGHHPPESASLSEMGRQASFSQITERRSSNISENDHFTIDPIVQSWGENLQRSSERTTTVASETPMLDNTYLGLLTSEQHPDTHIFNYPSGFDAYPFPSPGHPVDYLSSGGGSGSVAMADRPNMPWFSAPSSPAPHTGDYFGSLARMHDAAADFGPGLTSQEYADLFPQGVDIEAHHSLGEASRAGPGGLPRNAGVTRGRKRLSGPRRATEGDIAAQMDMDRDKVEQYSHEEAEKKHRGRPRLDNRDETAADRRRTQIRLAQRAYRQRKESTITSLRGRVEELESTLETMLNTFFEIHDSAIEQKIVEHNPQFGQTLRTATERILALSKEVGSSSSAVEEAADQDTEESAVEKGKGRALDIEGNLSRFFGTAFIPDADQSAMTGGEESYFPGQQTGLFRKSAPRSHSTASRESQGSVSNITNPTSVTEAFNLARIRATIPSRVHSPSPHQSLVLPPNEEKTFAQRLRRLALEWRYYRFANHGNTDASKDNQPSNFCMLFASKEECVESLKLLLSGRDREPFQRARFPLKNLGGSGLHYIVDRHTASGAIREIRLGSREHDLPTKTAESLRMTLISRGFGDKADEIIPHVLRLEEDGLLDPEEVEAVLALKGVRLTTTAASAVTPILVSRTEQKYQFQDGGSRYGASPPASSETTPPYSNIAPVILPSQNEDVPMEPGYRMPTSRPPYADYTYSKEVKVDVLLRELVLRCICTGIGPTFRRVDIDAALALASS